MDVCNQIAIVNQGREKSEEALDFLQQAHAYYKLENPNVDNAQGPELISEKWLKGKRTSLEANLTQTYFYYAQVYSKLGRADEGIEYSCKTMQRQLTTKTHVVKEFVMNCVHLKEYFLAKNMFEQSLYLLQSAMALLPEDQSKRKKLRATVQTQLGLLYLELLTSHNNNLPTDRFKDKVVTFDELPNAWPTVKPIESAEEAAHVFKLGNTQLQRAAKIFVLDGYVTDNIRIQQSISKLYKQLGLIEEDPERIMALIDRRIALLQPLVDLLNHNSYYNLIQEMSAELSEIYTAKFQMIFEPIEAGQKKATKKAKAECNKACKLSIQNAKFVVDSVYKSDDKFEFVQAVINMELNIASRYTKIFPEDMKEQVENMKAALVAYERLRKFVTDFRKHKNATTDKEVLSAEGLTQMNICDEMIDLLPQKISKVNYMMHQSLGK